MRLLILSFLTASLFSFVSLHAAAEDAEAPPPLETTESVARASDAQMEEAESIFNWCKADHNVYTYTDCECLASKFLEKRIEVGPIKGDKSIVNLVIGDCPNIANMTSINYKKCMSSGLWHTGNYERKEYCECYARVFAERYENHQGPKNMYVETGAMKAARNQCLRPESYK